MDQHRSEGGEDQLSIKVVNKGWEGVVNDTMCESTNSTCPCPALVLAGTTQVRDLWWFPSLECYHASWTRGYFGVLDISNSKSDILARIGALSFYYG